MRGEHLLRNACAAQAETESESESDFPLPAAMRRVPVTHPSTGLCKEDWVAEEVPVALVYNGISHAVMMATPSDLEAFALGFSLSEGIVRDPSEIYDLAVVPACSGMQVELTVSSESFASLKNHRRSLAGRTGCGLCGTDSLEALEAPLPVLPVTAHFRLATMAGALEALREAERIGELTGCTHSAVWADSEGHVLAGAEDVGRHIALDKVLGKRAVTGRRDGAVFISSRASYEMVRKAVQCGVEILCAVSAPTALAVDTAARHGLTLAAFCRPGKVNVYTHPGRLQ